MDGRWMPAYTITGEIKIEIGAKNVLACLKEFGTI